MEIYFTRSWNHVLDSRRTRHYKAERVYDVDDDVAQAAIQAGRAVDCRVRDAAQAAEGASVDISTAMDNDGNIIDEE